MLSPEHKMLGQGEAEVAILETMLESFKPIKSPLVKYLLKQEQSFQ